jgi:hypothetical protein
MTVFIQMEMLADLVIVHAKRDRLQKSEILEKGSCLWIKIQAYASRVIMANITMTQQ